MHYRLNVSFSEKERAKALGARWNYVDRYWFYEGDELPEGLKRWYRGEITYDTVNPADGRNLSIDVVADDPFKAYKSVTEVNREIGETIENIDSFQCIMVKGEVTNFSTPSNGHYYFAIKDDFSRLDCKMWRQVAETRLKFDFAKGKQVAIIGYLAFYEPNGSSSLIVRDITDMGQGAAALALLKLKEKLESEGVFDPMYKKEIPLFPKKVGIITSKDGQAIKDIEKVAKARNPYVERYLYHVNVQGENAVRTIIKGIKALDELGLDTIIVGRGGGSDEELSAYNDEELVRTVFNARTPIISAVGHEGNWSLVDYVADLRVPTPTQAANEAFPDVMSVLEHIEILRRGIVTNMRFGLQKRFDRLNTQKARLDAHDPVRKLKERKDRLAALSDGLIQRMRLVYNGKKNRFEVLTARLHGLSPTAKLVKGFGYITTADRPVTTVKDVAPGAELTVRIHDGTIVTEVKKTEEN